MTPAVAEDIYQYRHALSRSYGANLPISLTSHLLRHSLAFSARGTCLGSWYDYSGSDVFLFQGLLVSAEQAQGACYSRLRPILTITALLGFIRLAAQTSAVHLTGSVRNTPCVATSTTVVQEY